MNGLKLASILAAGVSCISMVAQASAQGAVPAAARDQTIAPVVTRVSAVQGSSTPTMSSADEAGTDPDDIVVTGSRVASNGNLAPTPVTVVPTERLIQTAPSSIPDALNRLPQFSAQPATRNIGSAQGNGTGNFLNLRRFGANRNLVLLDGNRVPPTATSGAVDTNIIPQSLVQRVEVVTGGASAVYGSDAVTGVINFVIDKNFNGLKFNSQIGTSTYGDATSWRVGGAAGMSLFENRGHIEFSYDHYDSKGLKGVDSRKAGKDYWIVGGDGTANNPFRLVKNGRTLLGSRGGMIVGSPPPALRDIVFNTNGVATPFIHGASSGVNGIESGGDGGYYDAGTLVAPLRTNQAFGRFDYKLTDDVSVYVQTSYSDSRAVYPYASARYVADILSGNPFIPANIQATMTATNTPSIRIGRLQSREDGLPGRVNDAFFRSIFAMGGVKGKLLSDFNWNANYIYSENSNKVINHNNTSTAKFSAAVDAVRDPATGRVVCQVSLTSFANLFPGCEPLNVFGPTAPSASAYDWMTDDTSLKLTNRMNDVNFSINGSPFSSWAGPVQIAISGEYRWLVLDNRSSVEGALPPNCAGIRDAVNCSASTPAWQHDVSGNAYAKQNVKEVAGEVLVPLLKDVPLVRSLELNLAGRYTDYSTSGSVKTWKIGGTWEVVSGLRVRATRSRDIRAPTLQDLFQPLRISTTGFTDLHTNISQPVNVLSRGNADLVPEAAMTTTVGIVIQPAWLPRFSLAVDYYDIKINNAIISASGFDVSIQRECEVSAGASPLCSLLVRPLPFSDRSASNFPTQVLSQNVNASRQWTRGVDVEANYNFGLSDVLEGLPGRLDVRALGSYQPVLKRQTISSLPSQQSAGIVGNPTGLPGISKVRATLFLDYSIGDLDVIMTERWQSSQKTSDRSVSFDLRPDVPAYSYTDISLSYKLKVGGTTLNPFLTVENVFNKQPPIIGGQNNVPGLYYPTGTGFDVVGRYFTLGIRGKF